LADEKGAVLTHREPDPVSEGAVYALVLVSIFFPTSWHEQIHQGMVVACFGAQIFLLGLITARRGVDVLGFVLLAAALGLLFAFTLLSRREEYALGAALQYGTPLLLFAVRIPPGMAMGRGTGRFITFFLAVNFLLLIYGFAIAADVQSANLLTHSVYSAFYDQLYEHMVEWFHKPVTVFATHSIAAFAAFVLFLANLLLYRARGAAVFMVFAVSHLVILLLLKSVSAIGFLVLSVLVLALLQRGLPRTLGLSLIACACAAAWWYGPLLRDTLNILTSTEGGFLGRYSEGAPLGRTIHYILQHPFAPIGLEFNRDVFYGDSGIIEYLVRGSVPLLLIVYASLWLFLRRFIDSFRVRLGVLCTIVLFETGYTILTYYRTTGLLVLLCLAYVASRYRDRPRFEKPAGARANTAPVNAP
jgi:hypothetical protein